MSLFKRRPDPVWVIAEAVSAAQKELSDRAELWIGEGDDDYCQARAHEYISAAWAMSVLAENIRSSR